MKFTRILHLTLLGLVMLGWALAAGAAQRTTFEGIGQVQQINRLDQQILIDGDRYVLPVAVARAATDSAGKPVSLRVGEAIRFRGSVVRGAKKIDAIRLLEAPHK